MGGDTPPGQSPTLRSNAGVYRQCIAGCYALTQTPEHRDSLGDQISEG